MTSHDNINYLAGFNIGNGEPFYPTDEVIRNYQYVYIASFYQWQLSVHGTLYNYNYSGV